MAVQKPGILGHPSAEEEALHSVQAEDDSDSGSDGDGGSESESEGDGSTSDVWIDDISGEVQTLLKEEARKEEGNKEDAPLSIAPPQTSLAALAPAQSQYQAHNQAQTQADAQAASTTATFEPISLPKLFCDILGILIMFSIPIFFIILVYRGVKHRSMAVRLAEAVYAAREKTYELEAKEWIENTRRNITLILSENLVLLLQGSSLTAKLAKQPDWIPSSSVWAFQHQIPNVLLQYSETFCHALEQLFHEEGFDLVDVKAVNVTQGCTSPLGIANNTVVEAPTCTQTFYIKSQVTHFRSLERNFDQS